MGPGVTDALLYVYAVTDANLVDDEVDGLRAVDDAPVHVIAEASVAAVVSAVDAQRFDASALKRNLEDLQWLEGVARAHDAVVSRLASHRPVAPVRLATVFTSTENVRTLLRTRARDFAAALDRVRGRCEWAVKGFVITGHTAPATSAPAPSLSPGRSYLERRRAERDHRAQNQHEALTEAAVLHDQLAQLAIASRQYPPQDRTLSGYRDEMVLNVAYLLPNGEESEFRQVIHAYQGRHLRLQLDGPWAPYSFATLEGDQ